jgi:NTE family protein
MTRIGLVLGGGAVRGLAHLGVLKALDKHGIQVDCIAGTSMGGLIGGLYAAGVSTDAVEHLIRTTPKYRLMDVGIRQRGLLAGNGMVKLVQQLMKEHGLENRLIEQFPIAFKAVSVDLLSGKQVIFDHGDLGLALRATTAFPGVFAPLILDEKMLVDGGVLNNLPVEELRGDGVEWILAVDVAREHERKAPRHMVEVVYRSYSLMTAERKHASLRLADEVIRPEVGHIAAFDFTKSLECIRAGEEATEQALASGLAVELNRVQRTPKREQLTEAEHT